MYPNVSANMAKNYKLIDEHRMFLAIKKLFGNDTPNCELNNIFFYLKKSLIIHEVKIY